MFIKKLAVTQEKRIYPIEDLQRSYNFSEGHLTREDLRAIEHKGTLKSTTGEEFVICDATFKDNMDRMKRRAAIIIPKDVGFIIAETGLTKDAVVLDCGAGSGGMTCQLAALVKHVYAYDLNPLHIKTVQENIERMDLDNVTLEQKDIKDVQTPEEVDLAVIDLPDPLAAIPIVKKGVKQSGHIVFYTPQITQAQDVINNLGDDFKYVTTIELLQRRWEVKEKVLRPKHAMLGHTAFLTIVRKFQRR
jgi:tRNA (adenine57-N1/adenine58-N1)-methyltransferase